jgi:hypothetical protein
MEHRRFFFRKVRFRRRVGLQRQIGQHRGLISDVGLGSGKISVTFEERGRKKSTGRSSRNPPKFSS